MDTVKKPRHGKSKVKNIRADEAWIRKVELMTRRVGLESVSAYIRMAVENQMKSDAAMLKVLKSGGRSAPDAG